MSALTALRTLADAQVNCLEGGGSCSTGLPVVQASQSSLQIILQIVFGIIGAVAVIIVILGALNMTLAEGDPGKVAKARQTVIFALVGLVVAISAEAIVTFVLGRL
jgi:hypothetical protein